MGIANYCQIFLKCEFFSTDFKKYKKVQKWNLVKIRPILPIQYSISLKTKYPPFNQNSILISPDSKSHSCFRNSVTAPILWQMNTCHILLLRIFLGSITVLFHSHKISCVNRQTKVF